MINPMGSHTLICGCLLAGAILCAAPNAPVVSVTGGQIWGQRTSDGGATFKGVPFARSPVGDLRWREPQPVPSWAGIRNATEFRPACTQISEGWNAADAANHSEDCLYLNVAVPEWPPKKAYPVIYWIHGGSNMAGSGEAAAIDQRALVRQGVIFVAVNYRLDALGFLAHPELAKESPHHTSGNYGLMDQIAGLRWVRDNIAQLGGDPGKITIAGESAGAMDVSLLMTSPLAKGLFHRASAESGTVILAGGPLPDERAEQLGIKLAEVLKAPKTGAIDYLRKIPAIEILKAYRIATGGKRDGLLTSQDGWVLPGDPVRVLGRVLSSDPIRIFRKGKSAAVPLLIGTNAQEVGQAEPAEATHQKILSAYGKLSGQALAAYGLAGGGEGTTDPLYGPPGVQWATDWDFRCPAVAQALWHASAGHPTYQYEFEHPAPGRTASVHAAELPFLFEVWQVWPQKSTPSEFDRNLARQMQAYWANFASTGNPNGEGLPEWRELKPEARAYLAFSSEGAMAKPDLRRAACEVFIDYWKTKK